MRNRKWMVYGAVTVMALLLATITILAGSAFGQVVNGSSGPSYYYGALMSAETNTGQSGAIVNFGYPRTKFTCLISLVSGSTPSTTKHDFNVSIDPTMSTVVTLTTFSFNSWPQMVSFTSNTPYLYGRATYSVMTGPTNTVGAVAPGTTIKCLASH